MSVPKPNSAYFKYTVGIKENVPSLFPPAHLDIKDNQQKKTSDDLLILIHLFFISFHLLFPFIAHLFILLFVLFCLLFCSFGLVLIVIFFLLYFS